MKKITGDQILQKKLDQRNKYLDSLLCKIHRTFLKLDKREAQKYDTDGLDLND